jgi:hypothetical protein
MNIKILENNRIESEFSNHELVILANSIFETVKEIEDWEFQTRIGVQVNEAKLLIDKFCKDKELLPKKEEGKIKIDLSMDELLIVNNSLNEVLNGFYLEDFERRIGAPVNEVKHLLIKIAQAFNEKDEIRDKERKDYFGYLR